MNRIKCAVGLLCTYAAYYTALILWDHCHPKAFIPKADEKVIADQPNPEPENLWAFEKKTDTILVKDTVLRSLWAYDNSDHKRMVHVRFDEKTVDLLTKFKMATGTDITKFVAFSVKYFLETNPELKTIIKQFIQNTEL